MYLHFIDRESEAQEVEVVFWEGTQLGSNSAMIRIPGMSKLMLLGQEPCLEMIRKHLFID